MLSADPKWFFALEVRVFGAGPKIRRKHGVGVGSAPVCLKPVVWESVCWGVLGTPYLFFVVLETHQDSTIVKFIFVGKHLGGADRFWPTQNSTNIQQRINGVFRTVWFNRICLCFQSSGFSKIVLFRLSDFQEFQYPTISNSFLFRENVGGADCFGPTRNQQLLKRIPSFAKICLV